MELTRRTVEVHGHRRAYTLAGPEPGTAPVLLLVHGIGDSSRTWDPVVPLLARTHTVIAPDLLGHGESDKPRADYSIGGFANGMRDLLWVHGVGRATVVGHSMGGGVALQLAYQFPRLVERLVLVASGGLGAEVSPLLRLLALPGTAYAVGGSLLPGPRHAIDAGVSLLARTPLLDGQDLEVVQTIWHGLRDRSARVAFLRTLRGVIDVRGQAVSSRDRLYLAAALPTMLVWGGRDPIVPVAHAGQAAEAMPHSRLEILPRAGHMPHRNDPQRFVALLEDFLTTTEPARFDAGVWRALLTGQPLVRAVS